MWPRPRVTVTTRMTLQVQDREYQPKPSFLVRGGHTQQIHQYFHLFQSNPVRCRVDALRSRLKMCWYNCQRFWIPTTASSGIWIKIDNVTPFHTWLWEKFLLHDTFRSYSLKKTHLTNWIVNMEQFQPNSFFSVNQSIPQKKELERLNSWRHKSKLRPPYSRWWCWRPSPTIKRTSFTILNVKKNTRSKLA